MATFTTRGLILIWRTSLETLTGSWNLRDIWSFAWRRRKTKNAYVERSDGSTFWMETDFWPALRQTKEHACGNPLYWLTELHVRHNNILVTDNSNYTSKQQYTFYEILSPYLYAQMSACCHVWLQRIILAFDFVQYTSCDWKPSDDERWRVKVVPLFN